MLAMFQLRNADPESVKRLARWLGMNPEDVPLDELILWVQVASCQKGPR